MTVPPTPKPTRKAEALAKAPPTIASRHEEDATLKEVALSRYRCANDILETRTKDGSTTAKAPTPRTNPKANEAPTASKPHTQPSHPQNPRPSTPSSSSGFTSSSILPRVKKKHQMFSVFFFRCRWYCLAPYTVRLVEIPTEPLEWQTQRLLRWPRIQK
jgi:hypothetical protein